MTRETVDTVAKTIDWIVSWLCSLAAITLLLICFFLLTGCIEEEEKERDSECQDSIAATIAANGEPDEVIAFDQGSYHSRSYVYMGGAFERFFSYGSRIDGCDIVDTYHVTVDVP